MNQPKNNQTTSSSERGTSRAARTAARDSGTRPRLLLIGALGILVIALLWAVLAVTGGKDGSTAPSSSPSNSRSYLFAELRSAHATAAKDDKPTTLLKVLPNQLYSIDGGPPAPTLDGLLLGTVTEVKPGRGFRDEKSAGNPKTLKFTDPKAGWRTLEVTTKVEIGWGGAVAGRKEVTFLLRIPGTTDADRAIAGVEALDEVLVGLNGRGLVAAEPEMALVALKGGLFGTIDTNGKLILPVLGDAKTFLGKIGTAKELRRIASTPRPTIDLVHRKGVLVEVPKKSE